jgi:hypothetical protein
VKAMAKSRKAKGTLYQNNRTNWETIKKKARRMIIDQNTVC